MFEVYAKVPLPYLKDAERFLSPFYWQRKTRSYWSYVTTNRKNAEDVLKRLPEFVMMKGIRPI